MRFVKSLAATAFILCAQSAAAIPSPQPDEPPRRQDDAALEDSDLGGSSSTPRIIEKVEGEEEEEEKDLCGICLDEMTRKVSDPEVMNLAECNHRFHTHCILRALQERSACPYCRGSPKGLTLCRPLSNRRGVALSYSHPSQGLIVAFFCSKTKTVQGPVGPWKDSQECPDWSLFQRKDIEDEIHSRCRQFDDSEDKDCDETPLAYGAYEATTPEPVDTEVYAYEASTSDSVYTTYGAYEATTPEPVDTELYAYEASTSDPVYTTYGAYEATTPEPVDTEVYAYEASTSDPVYTTYGAYEATTPEPVHT